MEDNCTLQDLFIKMPLGFSSEFLIVQEGIFNEEALTRLKNLLIAPNCRITAPCLWCGHKFPFNYKVSSQIPNYAPSQHAELVYALGSAIGGVRSRYGFSLEGSTNYTLLDGRLNSRFQLFRETRYLFYDFQCAGDEAHHYELLLRADVDRGRVLVTKVGQHPFPYELNSEDRSEYSRLLEKMDAKEDYRIANRCFYDGMYAGALIYLRRVFEKLMSFLANFESGDSVKMVEIIKSAREKIDPEIYDHLSGAYQMLSDHIHKKPEVECREVFEGLLALINDQLSYMKTEKERENSRKQVKKQIDLFLREKNSNKNQ